MAQDAYNPTDAKDDIADLLSQIEGHDLWIKEQHNLTQARLNAFQSTIKQGDRLKKMLENQINDEPTQQQYQLILALKSDFLKAISKIQDDLVSNSTGQSLNDSKTKILELQQENESLHFKLKQINQKIITFKDEIDSLRKENERLNRLRDLLMQQADAMNQRLSKTKGKDKKINELKKEKETLENNYKLQIKSLQDSCKEIINKNNELNKLINNNNNDDINDKLNTLQSEFDDINAKYVIQIEQINNLNNENKQYKTQIIELEKENNINILQLNEKYKQLNSKYDALDDDNKALKDNNQTLNDNNKQLDDNNKALNQQISSLKSELIEVKKNMDDYLDGSNNQISSLNKTITELRVINEENNSNNVNDYNILQNKLKELNLQINEKNKSISEHKKKELEMHNQREDLQNKLSESQKIIINYQSNIQQLELKMKELNKSLLIYKQQEKQKKTDCIYPTSKTPPAVIDDMQNEYQNINSQLQPVDDFVDNFVKTFKYNSQIFILDKDIDQIKDNKLFMGNNDNNNDNVSPKMRIMAQWAKYDVLLNNIQIEISSKTKNNKNISLLILELISQKIKLFKHIGKLHMNKEQQISQIMQEAQKTIIQLRNDLIKKKKEIQQSTKTKEKMLQKIKNVQQQVKNLTQEYQVLVNELDKHRGRRDSVDSTYS